MRKPESQKGSHPVFSRPHQRFRVPDPFAPQGQSLLHTVLATAMFRCWHILMFFCGWAVLITVLNHQGHGLVIQPTLLTVIGTVLGFVISYRTTSSFERYNEGRRLWSQIIFASRNFARVVWFHVSDHPSLGTVCSEEMKSQSMIEKKTAINLLEAYAVAVKHYLRGEDDGIYYRDLYYLVKFLPGYALPPGIPLAQDLPPRGGEYIHHSRSGSSSDGKDSLLYQRTGPSPQLPLPVTASSPREALSDEPVERATSRDKVILTQADEHLLYPAHMPPGRHLYDLFPFSLLAGFLMGRGESIPGRRAARLRAQMRDHSVSHNLPLEISLYLSSYVSSLQRRNVDDAPTISALLSALEQLVDALTGLERILTTPIPFSYSFHLWAVTTIYCLALPFQIYSTLNWLTIPGTIIASFIFFGFLAAGEEIENPFGYDRNDLNLEHFTHNIIRNELHAITSIPPPDPAQWALAPENDLVFERAPEPGGGESKRVTPEEWIKRGNADIKKSLSLLGGKDR